MFSTFKYIFWSKIIMLWLCCYHIANYQSLKLLKYGKKGCEFYHRGAGTVPCYRPTCFYQMDIHVSTHLTLLIATFTCWTFPFVSYYIIMWLVKMVWSWFRTFNWIKTTRLCRERHTVMNTLSYFGSICTTNANQNICKSNGAGEGILYCFFCCC